MTYNVFGGTLNPAQSNPMHRSLHTVTRIIAFSQFDYSSCRLFDTDAFWFV